jgi:hypothetical protein
MTSINPGLLTDTLNLVQLARETALAKGKQEQAQRLSPVVDGLKSLAANRQDAVAPPAPGSTMAQSDFGTLLAISKKAPAQPAQAMAGNDRNRMVLAMAGGNMAEKDIARQLGMTTDEVRMVVSANQKSQASAEVKK